MFTLPSMREFKLKGNGMKILIISLLTFSLQLDAMEKLLNKVSGSPRKDEKKEEKVSTLHEERHKKDDKEKTRIMRDDKQKTVQRESVVAHAGDRRRSEAFLSRDTKSASPTSHNASPVRASTVGKRGSLDWTSSLNETVKHVHMNESLKKWSEKDAIEENLRKLFEEFNSADVKRQREIYCFVMGTSLVSATKEAMASNFFDVSYKMATLALYNIPGYFSTNHEEAIREINTFFTALFDAKEAYVNKLSAEAPRRNKWVCERVVLNDPNSPINILNAQLVALKLRYPQYSKDLEPEKFILPTLKKP